VADMSANAHADSIARIFPRLGVTGTTAQSRALLASAT
jgi:hypothetical protein